MRHSSMRWDLELGTVPMVSSIPSRRRASASRLAEVVARKVVLVGGNFAKAQDPLSRLWTVRISQRTFGLLPWQAGSFIKGSCLMTYNYGTSTSS